MQFLATDAYIYNKNNVKPFLQKPKSTIKEILLYKTEYCRNWSELGCCRYGEKCRYAHGAKELRSTPRHIRYKTQICKAYHQEGECPYGLRCTFIHDEPIASNSNIKHHPNHSERNIYSITSPASSTSSLSPLLSNRSSLEVNDLIFPSPPMNPKYHDYPYEYSYPFVNDYNSNRAHYF
ncbi:hypothetical protein BJ944DRAFT_252795 [Cunninghamella echinulata]|nr:hypothetical protein BJ944DRAFT_252795 [Cunninghamella echinulata]